MNISTSIQLLVYALIALSSYGNANTLTAPKNFTHTPVPNIELEDVIEYATKQIDMLSRLEDTLTNVNITVHIDSPSYGQLIDSKPSAETHSESRYAEIIVKATTYLADKYYLSYGTNTTLEFTKYLSYLSLNSTSMGEMCASNKFKESVCRVRRLKYRSSDGSCNNLKKPHWGKSKTAYRRNMYPAYKDGLSEMNNQLPNPRELSKAFSKYQFIHFNQWRTMAVGIWALFIGHDMSHTVVSTSGATNKSIDCCGADGAPLAPRLVHPLCAPISVAEDDPLYGTCMNYVRSAPALRTDCTFGPREQVNEATHYLDASMIYGNSLPQMKSLRTNTGGLLATHTPPSPHNITVLPVTDDPTACQTASKCYRSGDSRVNSHPYVLAMYTVWVMEHNRVARELAAINTHWNDETLFQETRRIIVAMIQHITFAEWMPALLGHSNTNPALSMYFDLNGDSSNYNDTAAAATSNEFANVIVPMAYSTMSAHLTLYNNDQYTTADYMPMTHYHEKPYETLMLHFDPLLRGLATQEMEPIDMAFSGHVTDQLYLSNGYGMDIVSLSIQRSRDHGIPSYTQYRRPCGLTRIKNEKQLALHMNATIVNRLMKMYKSVDNIDLIVGALLENPANDSMISATMMCIMRDQLMKTRMGDRFFYDLPDVFTENQLAEIRKVTLSRLLCSNNHQTIKKIQLNAFKISDSIDFERVLCNSELIPKINLQHWEEIIDSDFK